MKEYIVKVYDDKTEWYLNGQLHREDGPAVVYPNGDRDWYKNGKLHREDGPAVEYANGDKCWYKNGQPHREDGPAIEYAGGYKYWYLEGEEVSEQEFNKRTNQVVEMTIAELEQHFGKRVKIIK